MLCSMMSFSAFITCFSKFDISVCFLSTLSTLSVFLNLNKSYKNRSIVVIKLPEVLLNNLHRGVLTEKQLSSDDVNSVSDCGTIAYVPNRLIVEDKLHPAHALIFVTLFSHIPPHLSKHCPVQLTESALRRLKSRMVIEGKFVSPNKYNELIATCLTNIKCLQVIISLQ